MAIKTASTDSSVKVSTNATRGTSLGICLSNASIALRVLDMINDNECGILPAGATPEILDPIVVEQDAQPPLIAA